MKVVVAPDSYKGSITAAAAARAIGRGVLRASEGIVVDEVAIADGGEGTVEALVTATGGRYVEAEVCDPLGRPVTARYGFLGGAPGKATAVIEMAAASGLPLLAKHERAPLMASTFGTGELILHALGEGARAVILGIGGSATVDGGTGMARALGARFLDARGRELAGGGGVLSGIARIDASALSPIVSHAKFTVACDVTNPLTGPDGAAAVYGPQKGATSEDVIALDEGLANLAERIRHDLGVDVERLQGAGAAGGLGAGLVAFLGATLRSGVEIVLDAVGLAQRLQEAALVLSGEGRVDAQSAFGKAVSGVADAARRAGVPLILLVGAAGRGADEVRARGVTAIFSIARGPAAESEMIAGAAELLERAAEEAMRAFLAGVATGEQGRRSC